MRYHFELPIAQRTWNHHRRASHRPSPARKAIAHARRSIATERDITRSPARTGVQEGFTVLFDATGSNRPNADAVRLLLRRGADSLIWSKRSHTPLDIAKGKCQDLCVSTNEANARILWWQMRVVVRGRPRGGTGVQREARGAPGWVDEDDRGVGELWARRSSKTRQGSSCAGWRSATTLTGGRALWWERRLTGGEMCAWRDRQRRSRCSRQTWSRHQMIRHACSLLTRRRPARHAGEDHAGEPDRSQRTGN